MVCSFCLCHQAISCLLKLNFIRLYDPFKLFRLHCYSVNLLNKLSSLLQILCLNFLYLLNIRVSRILQNLIFHLKNFIFCFIFFITLIVRVHLLLICVRQCLKLLKLQFEHLILNFPFVDLLIFIFDICLYFLLESNLLVNIFLNCKTLIFLKFLPSL